MKQEEIPIEKLLSFGIINIDKPSGPTSFTVSEHVMKQIRKGGVKIRKTSHFGTLDPKVTGVLPVALGRACRLTGYFIGHDKIYIGIMQVHKENDIKTLQKLINNNFTGKIQQLPPIKSRVKRAIREREVKRWELLESSEDKKSFLFIAEVQGGTYIRKLCSDLGEMEEVGGAHMLELRRIQAGVFNENDKEFPITDLYELEKAIESLEKGDETLIRKIVMPGEEAIKKIMNVVYVKNDKARIKQLLTGKPVYKEDVVARFDISKIKGNEIFAVFTGGEDRFLEIAQKPVGEGKVIGKSLFVYN